MAETKFPEDIDREMALSVLEQLRSCEDIDEVKQTMKDFLPTDTHSKTFFMWLNTLEYDNKVLKLCILKDDLVSIKSILWYHISNLRDFFRLEKDEDQSIFLTTIESIAEIHDVREIKFILSTCNPRVIKMVNALSYNGMTFQTSDTTENIHKILKVNLVLLSKEHIYPAELLYSVYEDLMYHISLVGDYLEPTDIEYVRSFCDTYYIIFALFYQWFRLLISKSTDERIKKLPVKGVDQLYDILVLKKCEVKSVDADRKLVILNRLLECSNMSVVQQIMDEIKYTAIFTEINNLSYNKCTLKMAQDVDTVHKIIGTNLITKDTHYSSKVQHLLYNDIINMIPSPCMDISKLTDRIRILCTKYYLDFGDFYEWYFKQRVKEGLITKEYSDIMAAVNKVFFEHI